MDITELAARVQKLEDIEEIRRLKATYCDLCDTGLDNPVVAEQLLAYFVDDATVDFGMGEGSTFAGRAGLTTFFSVVVPSAVSFCMHMVHNSAIDVDGDRARGRWYFEAPTTNAATKEAQWMAGRYIEEYIKVDGLWKFKRIEVQWNYIAPYAQGWGQGSAGLKAQAAGE